MMNILVTVVLLLVVFVGFLYIRQTRLIFVGVPPSPLFYQQLSFAEIRLPVDGAELQGWQYFNLAAQNNVVVIYFGGNAEDVAYVMAELAPLNIAGLYSFNYRGFAASTGTPSEKNTYEDALHIYDFVKAQNAQAQMIVIGRSLGSAVAGFVSANREVVGTVLITPLKSVHAMVRHIYPFVPVDWVLRHPFHLDRSAAAISSPALIYIAEHDEVIPKSHSMATYDAIRSDKKVVELSGIGHNDVFNHHQFMPALIQFIDARAQALADNAD